MRDDRVARQDPLRDAPVEQLVRGVALRAVIEAVIGRPDVDRRHAVLLPIAVRGRQAGRQGREIDEAVQEGRVAGVDLALEALEVVGAQVPLLLPAVLRRQRGPFELGQGRLPVLRPHIGPDIAAPLGGRIGFGPHLAPEVGLGRLVRHLDAVAVHVELPAVIDAAQAALLVAGEMERGAPVRAFLVEDADPPFRIPERDKVLAQQPQAHRVAIGPRQFLRDHGRNPEPAEQLAHRRAGADPAQQFVVFRFQHRERLAQGRLPAKHAAVRPIKRRLCAAPGLSRAAK